MYDILGVCQSILIIYVNCLSFVKKYKYHYYHYVQHGQGQQINIIQMFHITHKLPVYEGSSHS